MSVPLSTYRVQLHPGFGFDAAADIAGYLADLGVTHFYASPYLQAAPGSTHGYDVVDHSRVNAELGGDPGHARLCRALGEAGLGQVLDIVPNHMAITPENAWWWDVLENGPSSLYASYFDVDWDPPEAKLRNTVLMPILGDHYGRVLEAGEISVERDGGTFTVRYFDHVLPAAPRSLDTVLEEAARRCGSAELESIANAFGRLPLSTATDRDSVRERHRDKEVLRSTLARLLEESPSVTAAVDVALARLNEDWDALDSFLERQNYRLAFWRTAGRELDYRRFFDITTLIGLRTEDVQVFADTHALVLGWLAAGVLDGLRIDHPDGLRDPEGYLRRLADASGGAWVVVEKILEPGERLPSSWPVAGTTGYDFLNVVGGLFVDPAGEEPLTTLYASLTGEPVDYDELVHDKKRLVMRDVLAADVNRLSNLLVQLCESHRRYRDYTRHDLHEALREVIACFPVYRTYTPPDVAVVEHAVEEARQRRPDIDGDLLDFLRDLLLLRRITGPLEDELVARFQQLTGPVMAKGVEDTAFYNFNRLVALNEVGGDPSRFGVSVAAFHDAASMAAASWPAGMTALSTHDTKRSEDVRARLALLSEIPEAWGAFARRWLRAPDDAGVDRNAQYLLLQVLVGAHPLTVERAAAYMEKATKEAKAHTSWIDPVPAYDDAVQALVSSLFDDDAFAAELSSFVAGLIGPGWVNSLAQKLVQLTAPGVPDLYQGSELWDLSLVDPDNRRPVDFELRRRLLAELDGAKAEDLWARAADGLPKLLVVQRALALRRRRPDLFGAAGSYRSLTASGASAAHLVAFIRGDGAVTVAPRLVLGLSRTGWRDTVVALPDGRWVNVLTDDEVDGGTVAVGALLERFPVALLERQ